MFKSSRMIRRKSYFSQISKADNSIEKEERQTQADRQIDKTDTHKYVQVQQRIYWNTPAYYRVTKHIKYAKIGQNACMDTINK